MLRTSRSPAVCSTGRPRTGRELAGFNRSSQHLDDGGVRWGRCGSGRAATRRSTARRFLAALVVVWAAIGSGAEAQNPAPPVAVASVFLTTPAVSPLPGVATLDGSGSFDPDPGGSIAKYRWEVVTGAYQWLAISHASERSPTASFEVPGRALADRFGPSIEFRLTVTDSGSSAASDSAFVVFTINQAPVVDIAVTAKLLDPDDHEGYDDNGNGEIDENSERYALEGVIDGPGERGNADN